MSKRVTRSSSRRAGSVLSDIQNRLTTITEDTEVEQQLPSPQPATEPNVIQTQLPPAVQTVLIPAAAIMKAIHIAIPATNVTDPVPDSLVRNDLKTVDFKPLEHEFVPKFIYDTATQKSYQIRVGELTGFPGTHAVPAANVFSDSAATEAVVSGSVWEAITRGRNSEPKILSYQVTGFTVSNLMNNYSTRLLASIEDLSPKFEQLREEKKPLIGYNTAVAVGQFLHSC